MACHDCGRGVTTKTCEIHNPHGAEICKDCCVSRMKGHSCRWFELCW